MTNITVFRDVDFANEEFKQKAFNLTLCGNLAPLELTNFPSMSAFVACKAVSWDEDKSSIIDETRLEGESDAVYYARMTAAVNTELGKINSPLLECVTMTIPLFLIARGQPE